MPKKNGQGIAEIIASGRAPGVIMDWEPHLNENLGPEADPNTGRPPGDQCEWDDRPVLVKSKKHWRELMKKRGAVYNKGYSPGFSGSGHNAYELGDKKKRLKKTGT